MIYFHYAAPLLPLFWIASVEGNRSFRSKETCSFVRFARSRMAGHYRLCRRPDLDRAGLAHRHYDGGLV